MSAETESIDRKAEALRLLDGLEPEMRTDHGAVLVAAAQVHASLAIAEGQERVAEALEGRADTQFRKALYDIACLALNEAAPDDNRVRWRTFRIADDALKGAQS